MYIFVHKSTYIDFYFNSETSVQLISFQTAIRYEGFETEDNVDFEFVTLKITFLV